MRILVLHLGLAAALSLSYFAISSGALAAETAPTAAPPIAAATPVAADTLAAPAPSQPQPASGLTPIENLPIQDLQRPPRTVLPPTEQSAEATPLAEVESNSSLPHDLSPLAMFLQADLVVKSVMIGLGIASIITWTVGLYKTIELFAGRARLKRNLRAISLDTSLAAASQTLGNRKGPLRAFIDVAALELRMSTDAPDKNGIKERVASRLERIESAAVRSMNRGTGVLATIGATAPFIGLFGTVWGIMNSFIGISKSQTTNLAVVAPGIAEALQATAIGLIAAIPAVIIYNWFARATGVYRALAGDASAEVMRLVSRDLDRVGAHRHARAAE
jgi:biopolymer transport protein ExbB